MSLTSLFRSSPVVSFPSVPDRKPAARGLPRSARPRVLLVSSLISLPYRVMRVARDAGADVYVLGNPKSACLRYSRYCKQFVPTDLPITGEADGALVGEINRCVTQFGIDMILPGDVQATRSLIAIRDTLDAPCFPMPSLQQFDRLNDKWYFTQLCGELGVKTPKSWFMADADALRKAVDAGQIPLPAIAKPINHDGSLGVIKLSEHDVKVQIARIDYAPIIVQEFIEGDDIGASVYCERGEIKAFIAHELKRATYRSLGDLRIVAALSKVMTRMGVDGVYNFDMRLAPDGTIYYLECNPRFFFKINLSMLAGVNFVKFGLDATLGAASSAAPNAAVRMPKALAAAALTAPWTITARDLKTLWYFWGDPLSSAREALGIDWEYAEDATERHFIDRPAEQPVPAEKVAA